MDSVDDHRPKIPTPLSRRWHRFRVTLLQVPVFLGIGLAAIFLWSRYLGAPTGVGEVYAVQVDLISLSDGMITDPGYAYVQPFHHVTAGQVLARLENKVLQASLDTLRSELAQLQAELHAEEVRVQQEQEDRQLQRRIASYRLAAQADQFELDVQDREVQLEANKAQLQFLNETRDLLESLRERQLTSRFELLTFLTQQALISMNVEGAARTLPAAEALALEARSRLQRHEASSEGELSRDREGRLLDPAREALKTQQARIRELEAQLENLELRSPVEGKVSIVHRWPGQVVRAGDAVATIAPSRGQFIVTHLRDNQRFRPTVGMAVDVKPRRGNVRAVGATVDDVGAQVTEVPPHQLRDPRYPEWGLPVRICLPADLNLPPGELVDVAFRRE